MKFILIASLIVGVAAAIVVPFFAELHVYRVTSGYSGAILWLTYSQEPSEERLLDAVILGDPLIQNGSDTTMQWRRAQTAGTRLFIKKDASVSVLVMPFTPSHNANPVFGESNVGLPSPAQIERDLLFGDIPTKTPAGVQGVWLTEPSTRTKYWPPLVAAAYSIGSFLFFAIGTLVGLTLVRWVWYFFLRRVGELSSAARGTK